jgi:hypothetical protein
MTLEKECAGVSELQWSSMTILPWNFGNVLAVANFGRMIVTTVQVHKAMKQLPI